MVSWTFEKDRGYKITDGNRSCLLGAMTGGYALSDDQRIALARHLTDFIDQLAGRTKNPHPVSQVINGKTIPQLGNDEAFKFTDEEGLNYWLNGSIRLSSPAFYLDIENAGSRDHHEGFGHIDFYHDDYEMHFALWSGFSSLVICTSSDARKSSRRQLHERFGPRLIRINRLQEFCAKVRDLADAKNFTIRDVTYSDIKIVTWPSDLVPKIKQMHSDANSQLEVVEFLATEYLDDLIDSSELATVFCKPIRHRIERERRLLFRFNTDVSGPKDVQSDSLKDHIELIV